MHFIIILGCGRGLEKIDGKLSLTQKSHMTYRLLKAIEVYSGLDVDEKVIICSGGGSGEAKMMKDFLIKRGIPESRMLLEPYSKTTIENCIFTYDSTYCCITTNVSVALINSCPSIAHCPINLDALYYTILFI